MGDHPDLTQGLDWYFVLSANPDGYAFTRSNNRMWRKTRSDNGGILHCKGVDANRNWGFQSQTPDDYDQMYELALRGGDALTAVHGKTYETGCIPCMLYIASGSSTDWAHGEAGIGFTTSMELRDTGANGFLLPPAQIIPTAEETWAFHITVIRELMAAKE